MSVAERIDEICVDLDEALEDGVISFEEFCFLRVLAEATDGSSGGWKAVFMLALATPRMNGSPDQVHPAIRESAKRIGRSGAVPFQWTGEH